MTTLATEVATDAITDRPKARDAMAVRSSDGGPDVGSRRSRFMSVGGTAPDPDSAVPLDLAGRFCYAEWHPEVCFGLQALQDETADHPPIDIVI